jgi:hypothetical protein
MLLKIGNAVSNYDDSDSGYQEQKPTTPKIQPRKTVLSNLPKQSLESNSKTNYNYENGIVLFIT